jgi:2,3-bisphosphoglycerate-independent phosphoglycerate mutase
MQARKGGATLMDKKLDLIKQVRKPADTKIVLLVMDGLGGLPVKTGGATELEAPSTPNLDDLASRGICGLHEPVGTAITPGSGPGHLALFGYDPLHYQVGRGVLTALGIGFDLDERDVAARGNFCTVDDEGQVSDRRAGRISTKNNRELCEKLRQIDLSDVELFVETVKEHRFLLVLRGEHLSDDVGDTDPQETGVKPISAQATSESQEAQATAKLVQQFVGQARERLRDVRPANMVLLRGFARRPDWPSFPDVFGLRAAALADYPMYRGVARLLGMKTLETGGGIDQKIEHARETWHDYDFFFLHHKPTDSAGEDRDFDRKAQQIEQVDAALPRLLEMQPDVVIVTGDHSTPSALAQHSWHPVPVVLWSQSCRPDRVERFGEHDCVAGGLGPRLPTTDLMPLAMAHARRLDKFGA